jgi:hypothetical protein
MPVHTAYAVPIGNVLTASERKIKLTTISAPVAALGHNRDQPSVYLSPTAHAISVKPARKR